MSKYTLKALKKRLDDQKMTLEEAAYIIGELLQEVVELEAQVQEMETAGIGKTVTAYA